VTGLKRQHIGILTHNHGSATETKHQSTRHILMDKESFKGQMNNIVGNGNVAKKIMYVHPKKNVNIEEF
jgi:hypothetical protein